MKICSIKLFVCFSCLLLLPSFCSCGQNKEIEGLKSTIAAQKSTIAALQSRIATFTKATLPEGSVIHHSGATGIIKGNNEYYSLFITATIMNVGGDGAITVLATVNPQERVRNGINQQQIKIFLKQGEEKEITFDFAIQDLTKLFTGDDGLTFSVVCI